MTTVNNNGKLLHDLDYLSLCVESFNGQFPDLINLFTFLFTIFIILQSQFVSQGNDFAGSLYTNNNFLHHTIHKLIHYSRIKYESHTENVMIIEIRKCWGINSLFK